MTAAVDVDDPTAWMKQAACRGATRVMFPGAHEADLTRQALDLCATCPVLDDCRRWISHPDQWEEWTGPGIWAGLPWSTRRNHGKAGAARVHAGQPIAPDRTQPAPTVPGEACREKKGTHAGRLRHQRAGETPCPDCMEARRLYQIAYRQRTREEATA